MSLNIFLWFAYKWISCSILAEQLSKLEFTLFCFHYHLCTFSFYEVMRFKMGSNRDRWGVLYFDLESTKGLESTIPSESLSVRYRKTLVSIYVS